MHPVNRLVPKLPGPETYGTHVICHHDGRHQWLIPSLLHGSCTLDVRTFPYDQQQCTFTFLSWTHDMKELDLILDSRPVVTKNYVKSAEWGNDFIISKFHGNLARNSDSLVVKHTHVHTHTSTSTHIHSLTSPVY